MSDFIRELEEDIQDERIVNFWRSYGNYLIGLAVAIVFATIGYTFWKYMNNKWQQQAHAEYSTAVQLVRVGKKDQALQAFQKLAEGKGGYAKLSKLYEASLLSNPTELYAKMSKQYASDPALGKLVKVLSAVHDINNSKTVSALESLSAPNHAWSPLSLELLALENLKKGEPLSAAQKYLRILDEKVSTLPEQSRARLMITQIDVPLDQLIAQQKEGKSQ